MLPGASGAVKLPGVFAVAPPAAVVCHVALAKQ